MSTDNTTHVLTQTTDRRSESGTLKGLFHEHDDGDPLPSAKVLEKIIEPERAIPFPEFYGKSSVNIQTLRHQTGSNSEHTHMLCQQADAGLCCHPPVAANGSLRVCAHEPARMTSPFSGT